MRSAGERQAKGTAGRRLAERRGIYIAVFAIAALLRLLYLLAQPGSDPGFSRPSSDGAYYLQWAAALAGGGDGPTGAYYLAPLYPHVLALFVAVFGERLGWLYAMQHLLAVATAIVIALGGRRIVGERPALLAAALFLLHQPLLFYYSRPLGEPLALFLLFTSLVLAARASSRSGLAAGLVAGIAALARPNLLLIPVVWAIGEVLAGRRRRAGLIVAGAALALLPVTVRNAIVAGHFVPVSSNSGITAYHGNGPGALGVFTLSSGFSGDLRRQREEATALASIRAGRDLDPVQADRWWGREALRVRLADPGGTVALLLRRAALILDNHEYGLNAHPLLDSNPWRLTWRLPAGREIAVVPFALLLGLAVVALAGRGWEGSGGWWTWTAIAACALTPLLFYVSCRYRLPLAALLAVPAGCGLSSLVGAALGERPRPGAGPLAAAGAALALSLLISFVDVADFESIRRRGHGEGLSNRAVAHQRAGDLEAAERDARRSVAVAPDSATSQYNLGVILYARGRHGEAERSYRTALELSDGTLAEAAANLSKFLIQRGQVKPAIAVLTRALEARPTHASCWTNLVVALVLDGRPDAAGEAVRRAGARGVVLDPGLVSAIESGTVPGSTQERR